MTDEITFAPPDDNEYQTLMLRALRGTLPVFGVAVETAKVVFVRAFPAHRPELTHVGAEIVETMRHNWQAGSPIRPWLWVRDGKYVVSDDYFWLALIEKYRPESIAAQVIGEPLDLGLLHKVGPLPLEQVEGLLGLSVRQRPNAP